MIEQHFLQAKPWALVQEALGRAVVEDSGEGWRYQAALEQGRLNTRLYSAYGPEVHSPEALVEALESLKEQGRKLGATYLRLEPTGNVTADDLRRAGLVRAPHKQPEHTQRINVNRDFAEVLAEMASSQRNRHRNYSKKGLSVRSSTNPEDIEHLLRLLEDVAGRTGAMMHEADYLRTQARTLIPLGAARMYLVEKEGTVLAASLVYEDEDRSYYAHAASDSSARNLHPGSILVSQIVEDACASAQKEVDLYGVVPVTETEHPWFGFSEFKRSFGGYQHDYLGTWEYTLKPIQMAIYRLLRRVVG